ncbi:MAG: hypothetical protein ACFCGT_09165 [Sandaracinaceae bacterium]
MRLAPRPGPLPLVATAVALACLTYAQALTVAWSRSGGGDWQWFHHMWEVGRVALLRWGEVPLWDPHHCGGVTLWGQPQAQVYAPTWWITGLPFGTVVGHKLFVLLHHAVGWLGTYALGRRLYRLAPAPAALTATVWSFGGAFAWDAAGGHATFLALHYAPWIWLFWRRANDDLRYAVGVALGMTLQLLEGGTYAFVLTFLLLFVDAVGQVVAGVPPLLGRLGAAVRDGVRGRLRAAGGRVAAAARTYLPLLRTAAVAGVLTALLGSVRLLPVYLTLSRFPRRTQAEDGQTLEDLLLALTGREPQPWHWGHRWVWAEYGAFIGWTCVLLALLGAAVALRRRRAAWLVPTALLFGACAMGNRGAWWPWPLLHHLPVFASMHVPSRFHVLLTLPVALLAGVAADAILRALRRSLGSPGGQALAAGLLWLLVFGAGAEVLTNSFRIAARWDGPTIDAEAGGRFHYVGRAAYLESYASYPRRHVGTASCYDPLPWRVGRGFWVGEGPQARIDPPGAGEVTGWGRSHLRVWAEVRLSAPARVRFNQNYDDGWAPSVGRAVDEGGLYAVDAPAGEHRIEATYRPWDLPWALGLSAIGALLSALLWVLARRAGPPPLPPAASPGKPSRPRRPPS